jgi:uncharacterized protein (DUF4415 family)
MDESDRDVEMREEYDFSEATRGAVVPPDPGKTRITIRLDTDVLDWFRAQVHAQGGGNYQTLINRALRAYIARQTLGSDAQRLEALMRQQAQQLETLMGREAQQMEALIHQQAQQFEALVRRIIREEVQSGR